jgi:hypothetical protein
VITLEEKNRNGLHWLTILVILVLLLLYLVPEVCSSQTTAWSNSTPEEQGINSQMLADMLADIAKNKFSIDSIYLIRWA